MLTCGWYGLLVCAAAFTFDIVRRALLPRTSFKGMHVVVTGGSAGIGKAVAKELLAKGARVTLLARTKSKLEQAVADLITGLDESMVQYVCASTGSATELDTALATASASFGPVDVLVANAGAAAPGLFLEMPMSTFEQQVDQNYLGTVRSIKAVLPQMVQQGRGKIIIMASGAAVVSFMGYSSYAPTKWALRGFADALRNEMTGLGVSVHIAYPCATLIPTTPPAGLLIS